MTAKIEPWMMEAVKEWEAKEKALLELAEKWMKEQWHEYVHPCRVAENCAAELRAILNREQEKQP